MIRRHLVELRTRALLATLALAAATPASAQPPLAPDANPNLPTLTLLFAPGGPGRLGEDLMQELVASGFAVSVASPDSDALATLRTPGARTRAVLSVADGVVTIHARTPASEAPRAPIELRAETPDRPTRRRLCLAVVERLRRLESEEGAAPGASSAAAPIGGAAATSAAPPAGPATPAVPAPPAPVALNSAVPAASEPRRRPWALGFASALNVISSRGTPSGHVLVAAEHQLRGPFALAAKVSWPVLAAHVTDGERSVRTWTFAAEIGANLRLARQDTRLRPVVGLALGVRGALADTDEFELRSSHLGFVPALAAAANLGLRFRVRPLIDLFLEGDLSQGVALVDARDYERAAATERVVRVALGALFEY